MRVIKNDTDQVRCFDKNVYLQEKNIAVFEHTNTEYTAESVKVYTDVLGTHQEPFATFNLDADGRAVIDMSDYIRAYPNTTKIYMACNQDYGWLEIPITVSGNINPKTLIIPALPCELEGAIILPPSVILDAIEQPNILLIAGDYMIRKYYNDTYDELEPIDTVSVVKLATGVILSSRDYQWTKTWPIKPLGTRRAATVEWVGITGHVKRATFYVKKHTIQSYKTELSPLIGQYKSARGRSETLTLYIDGLNAYDMWYYSDIITSPSVRVVLDEDMRQAYMDSGRISERYEIEVVTGSSVIPDGNSEHNTFEVQIKYRDYAKITM